MIFLDTNIFLRFLIRDDPEKAEACRSLLRRVQEGTEEATTSETVLAEVAYVLSSPKQYALSHADVGSRLGVLLALRGLKLANKRRIQRALELYSTYPRLDFEDCLSVAQIEQHGIPTLVSYDRGFDRVPGITRVEP